MPKAKQAKQAKKKPFPLGFKVVSPHDVCEHCGELEPGSLVKDDGGVRWCIDCQNANEPMSNETYQELGNLENDERILAFEAILKDLKSRRKK